MKWHHISFGEYVMWGMTWCGWVARAGVVLSVETDPWFDWSAFMAATRVMS